MINMTIIPALGCFLGALIGIIGIIVFFRRWTKERYNLMRIRERRVTDFGDIIPALWNFVFMIICLGFTVTFIITGINFVLKG